MPTTSTMPRTGRGVGMNKSKKKKQVPVEPLQEPPAPMSCCDPAAPQVETFEEQVSRVTGSMSPEKSRVVRLCMEMQARDKWCASIDKCQQHLARECKYIKREMRAKLRTIAALRKAPTKKDKATRKADEERLATCRKEYEDLTSEWLQQNAFAADVTMRYGDAKIARLERLLRDAGGEW